MEFNPEDIRLAVDGNEAAFNRISAQATAFTRSYFVRELKPDLQTAEDLSQEVMIKVCRKLHLLKEPKAFFSWLRRISKNTLCDYNQKQRSNYTFNSPLDIELKHCSSDDSFPDKNLIHAELSEMVGYFMRSLTPKAKTIFKMFYFKGMKITEISAKTGFPLGTVKRTLLTCRRRLEVFIKDNYSVGAFT